jgi:hypothetical protein
MPGQSRILVARYALFIKLAAKCQRRQCREDDRRAKVQRRRLAAQTRPSGFSKAARRSATGFPYFASTKQPFVISGSRPFAGIR